MPKLKTVTIRDVDQEVYKMFKLRCMENECSVGSAISEAMSNWIVLELRTDDEHSLCGVRVSALK